MLPDPARVGRNARPGAIPTAAFAAFAPRGLQLPVSGKLAGMWVDPRKYRGWLRRQGQRCTPHRGQSS